MRGVRRRTGEHTRGPSRARLRSLVGASLVAASACGPASPSRPNLLLITVDTLRPDRLACYGGAEGVGTGLCALAEPGTRFVWAFSAAPSTAPSIASLLTSRIPSRHGVAQLAVTRLGEEAVTVAERLAEAGYATAAFVANPVLTRNRGLGQGFAIYDDRLTRWERNRPGLREREAAATTDAALAWARVAEPPWFLWLHYQDPHGPYEPPGSGVARESPGGQRLPLLADHSGYRGIPRYQELPGVRGFEAYARRYLDEIRYLDEHVVRLVAALDQLGSAPAIVLTADHGEAFGEDDHYFAHGHSVGLEQIRVPLLMRTPAGSSPRVVEHPVSTLDIAPTLLGWAGVSIPDSFEGVPLPETPEEAARGDPARRIFAEHRLRVAMVEGRTYYARDRRTLDRPVPDPITGGRLVPLPPRIAGLTGDGSWPRYEPAEASRIAELEPALAALAKLPPPPIPEDEPLSDQARDQLRALGYLE